MLEFFLASSVVALEGVARRARGVWAWLGAWVVWSGAVALFAAAAGTPGLDFAPEIAGAALVGGCALSVALCIGLAQLAMRDVLGVFGAPAEPLPPAHEAQGVAVEELSQALALLSPPQQDPPSQQEEPPDEEGGEGEDQPEPGDEGPLQEGTGQGQTPEDAPIEEMGDPSRLLQGVRDREAERRRARERNEQRRRSEPVERDW